MVVWLGRIDNQDMLMLRVKSLSPVCCGCVLWLLENCCYRPTGSSSLEYSPQSLYKSTMTCSSPTSPDSELRSNVQYRPGQTGWLAQFIVQIPPVKPESNICTSQQSSRDLQQQLAGTAGQSEQPGHLYGPIRVRHWLCNKETKEFVPCQLVLFHPTNNQPVLRSVRAVRTGEEGHNNDHFAVDQRIVWCQSQSALINYKCHVKFDQLFNPQSPTHFWKD